MTSEELPSESPRNPRGWFGLGGAGTRGDGPARPGNRRARWRNIIQFVALALAIVLAALAMLSQRRWLNDAVADPGSSTPSSAASDPSASASATAEQGQFEHLVNTIGHSFTSSGEEAAAVAHLLGPSWKSTTSGVSGET